ncbi:Multidrug resistance protein MdtA [Usitatibacter rugosus]|uniref:Multidrug resistance protein MdtA n=1 Tax=Usitatibacter rugosus TaxID=2732067 RepID=A0A6M4GWE0_9PROT|nr:efflux RND transporter periplasmic adaptor subunit [Usitatibacter rugosus]QJR10814.1 Multidrug resistance protein MdtA [Usitatibacter rugosus]
MTERTTIRRAKIVAIVVLVLLALGAGRTVLMRHTNAKALEAGTADYAKLYVKTARATVGAGGETVLLPGSLQGATQAPISSRASGYLKRWTKDIGSLVEKGDLLAEIESPEIDQQLSQAMAAREQAVASLGLAKSTVDRWEALRAKDVVAQQELDEKRSGYAQAQANLNAASANVERLRQLEGFKRVVAPFAGLVTRRNVDVGDLIDGGSGKPLFILTQADSLRVYVNVPQSYANLVKPGQKVGIMQPEMRGQSFEGIVARTAGSIDATTRTMQVEIALPNKGGVLMPGAYVQVSLPLQASRDIVISTNALIVRGDGVRVASVGAGGKVRLLPVKLGRNYGQSVEVTDGLAGSEELVLNPPDALADGDVVTVAKDAEKTDKGDKTGKGEKKA